MAESERTTAVVPAAVIDEQLFIGGDFFFFVFLSFGRDKNAKCELLRPKSFCQVIWPGVSRHGFTRARGYSGGNVPRLRGGSGNSEIGNTPRM